MQKVVSGQQTVLMACTHHWDSPMQVGSQNLGRQFLKKRFRIGYLSAPLTPLHLAQFSDQNFWHRLRQSFSTLQEHPVDVVNIVPFSLIAPAARSVLNSAAVKNYWNKTTIPNLLRRLKKYRFYSPDILYIDNLNYWFLAARLKPRKIVFRVMDNYMGIPGIGPATKKTFKWLCSRANLVVYTARGLSKPIDSCNPRSSMFVPNGVELDIFNQDDIAIPNEYRVINAPIVVYVGDIDERFDLDLLEFVANKLGHIAFVLIGPAKRVDPRIATLQNVHILGPRPYSQIPSYIKHARVGIIPFHTQKYQALIDTICPLKLFQYMACGLSVVSTRWKEIELMNSPAALCQSKAEFAEAIDRAATENYDPSPYLEYAHQAGWDKRAGAILEKLGYALESAK